MRVLALRVRVAKLVLSITVIGLILLLILNDSYININDKYHVILFKENTTVVNYGNTIHQNKEAEKPLLFDHCKLADLDPWDPTIKRYLDPFRDPLKNCKPKVPQISKMENGKLFIYPPPKIALNCRYMCLYPKNDYALIFGNWTTVINGTEPKCDVVEIECKDAAKNETKEIFYKFLHAKIYRPDSPKVPSASSLPPPEHPTTNQGKPDVHIIIFDSVSQSQFIRSLPKTRHVLREYYDAIPFRHLNKVGLNSRPNGFAFLFGYGIYPIPKSPMSKGHEPDLTYQQYCKQYLDNDQFIGNRFKDGGYTTMMSEDWSMGVFNWPGCYGYERSPTDHYMRPYQLRIDGHRRWRHNGLLHIVQHYSCKESFHYQTQYLQDFINAYPDKPKFTLTWTSNLAHDDLNALYHTDDFFYNFFKDNREKLKNSYVLFMGDHGNRFSFMRYTEVGQTEDRNPFLFLSVPEHLRKNHSFIDTIKENAQQLTTHYDIYATLNEIVKPENPRIQTPHIKGSSFFHPLPQPRTCDKLRIPFEYCQCQLDKTRLPKDNKIALPAAELMVARMNENLHNTNDTTDVCAELTLDPDAGIFVDEFVEKGNVQVFEVYFKTQPGGGMFSGFLTKSTENGTLEIFSEKFPRMNSYGAQAQCAIESNFASYCFCKNLLKKDVLTTQNPISSTLPLEKLKLLKEKLSSITPPAITSTTSTSTSTSSTATYNNYSTYSTPSLLQIISTTTLPKNS